MFTTLQTGSYRQLCFCLSKFQQGPRSAYGIAQLKDRHRASRRWISSPSDWLRMKRPAENQHRRQQPKKQKQQDRFEGSHDEVLVEDIKQLLLSVKSPENLNADAQNPPPSSIPGKFAEIEVRISELSSTGDALGFTSSKDHAFVVPFALPGELIKAKVIRSESKHNYSVTDFLEVIEPSSKRDPSLVKCQYFAKCSGCQFQMIPYEDQLKHKKTIIEKAYKNFSGLPLEKMPAIGETIGSPLQYGYRTKLTPHFDGPPGVGFKNRKRETFKSMPPFGFMQKNTRWTIDIEDCPIGTDTVLKGLDQERKRLAKEFGNYSRGATILLRESTERKALSPEEIDESKQDYQEIKTCITDSNATSTEYVGSHVFTNPAGSFFQNNNSILPTFTQYIKDQILQHNEAIKNSSGKPLKYLIDAYCGSGLFTISLSSLFESSLGIDIAEASIAYATKNALLNGVKNSKFISATASKLFESASFDPEETLVVIDPPRKGCDEDFIKQLLKFGPSKIVYVSCNVHTQARDIGMLMNESNIENGIYRLDSLQGFDFFPQTGHVEGVAFLTREKH